nr:NADH dehydrogenase subunit 5 [Brachyponera chinensis]
MIYIYVIYMIMVMILMFSSCIYMFLFDWSLVLEWLIMSFNSMNIEFLIYMDWMSTLFISIVMLISSMVMIYSVVYMQETKFIWRFFFLVMLFIFSMILMILSPNMISIMFGWDGLGLVSFCLVIYYQNYYSYNSGMLTVLLNRFGDVMILMSISLLMMYGSWNLLGVSKSNILIMLILIASMTKSAQLPFSSWLPSAMAAPTPVSALVHSSTLVTAGVYLMIRFSKFFMLSNLSSYLLMILSILTMFMSGLMANFENDLKKIIALSTLSQLGMMMMILSLGFPILAFYHLLTHAIFKSLLFMSAGVLIHVNSNNQDIRCMGGLSEFIPFSMISFQITLMSLSGFPFFSGFYSKDLIMEFIYCMKFNIFMYLLSLISLMLTIMYSFRLFFYLFFSEMKIFSLMNIYESKLMSVSMVILMVLSILFGSLLNWMFFFNYNIFLSMEMKLLTMTMILLSMILLLIKNLFNLMKIYYLVYFFSSMWFLNYMYMYSVKLIFFVSFSKFYSDKVWMEFYSKNLIFQMIYEFKNFYMDNNYKAYLFSCWIIFFLILLLLI